MGRTVIICLLAVMFFSCEKVTVPEPSGEGATAALSLSIKLGGQQTRAFFDNTAEAEPWEKQINSLTLYIYNRSNNHTTVFELDSDQIQNMSATIELPYDLYSSQVILYAVANFDVGNFSGYAITSVCEYDQVKYNGTFADATTGACRAQGFVMTGQSSCTLGGPDTTTDVSLELKRSVAKLALITTINPDIGLEYGGAAGISEVTLSGTPSVSYIFEGKKYEYSSNTIQQKPDYLDGQHRNLFYLYERDERTGPPNLIYHVYLDADGDPGTTADRTYFDIRVPLDFSGNGVVNRNTYYRVTVNILGLDVASVRSSVTVADWTDTEHTQIDYYD